MYILYRNTFSSHIFSRSIPCKFRFIPQVGTTGISVIMHNSRSVFAKNSLFYRVIFFFAAADLSIFHRQPPAGANCAQDYVHFSFPVFPYFYRKTTFCFQSKTPMEIPSASTQNFPRGDPLTAVSAGNILISRSGQAAVRRGKTRLPVLLQLLSPAEGFLRQRFGQLR